MQSTVPSSTVSGPWFCDVSGRSSLLSAARSDALAVAYPISRREFTRRPGRLLSLFTATMLAESPPPPLPAPLLNTIPKGQLPINSWVRVGARKLAVYKERVSTPRAKVPLVNSTAMEETALRYPI